MSSAIPFFGKTKVKISKSRLEFVELDVSLNETHSYDTVITDHPVEAGANISDHVRVSPVRLKISGVVSNTPLSLTQINLNPIRAEQALGTLLQWQEAAELLTVATTLSTYESFLLKSVSVQRDKEKANGVFVDLEFQMVSLAESATATVEPTSSTKAVTSKKSVGKKPTTTVTPKRSLALKGIKALTGL